MNEQWQQKMEALDLQASPVDSANVICTLSSCTLLHVTGDDAESFLQALFSNDVAALQTPDSQLSTWSSPKGRVITMFRLVRVEDGFVLAIPTELLDPVLKKLRMYVLRSKVVIEPRDDLILVGVGGDKGAQALSAAGVDLPQAVDATLALPGGGWISKVRGQHPRYEIIAAIAPLSELWDKCVQSCDVASEAAWRLQNIDAGLPSVSETTSEAFVLQMLNLQHIDGVNFKKGCFPGQEVVARMQYLGKLKRQMYRLLHKGDSQPVAGDEIFTEGRGSAVGKVVDAVSVDGNSSRMLAVMAIAEIDKPLFLDKDGKQVLELMDFPYETPLAN